MLSQHAPEQRQVEMARLLFQKQGRPAPTFEGSGLLRQRHAQGSAEIELAAVVGPPAAGDSRPRQAGSQTLPILADQARVAGGPHALTLPAECQITWKLTTKSRAF